MPTRVRTLPSGQVVEDDGTGRVAPTRTDVPNTPDYSQYLPGGHPAGWTPAYGAPYNVPDPRWAAEQARIYNEQALPFLQNTANDYNLFNYNQRMGQVTGTPGWGGVQSNLQGQLQDDEINQLARLAAERGIGFDPGSPNISSALLRSMGLLGSQKQALGQQQLLGLLGQFQGAAPYDIQSQMLDKDAMLAALTQAAYNAGLPDPKAAADEEFRKMMAAIEAGKATAGGGAGPVGGGTDLTKLLDYLKGQQGGGPTPVGTGPPNTINRGTPGENIGQVPLWQNIPSIRQNYVDPGASGGTTGTLYGGRPADVIQNAFKTPGFQDVGVRGGLGLDPSMNAILSTQLGGMTAAERLMSDQFGKYGNVGNTYGNTSFGPGGTIGNQGPVQNPWGTRSYTPGFGDEITSSGMRFDTQGGFGAINPKDYEFGAAITGSNLFTGGANSDLFDYMFGSSSSRNNQSVGTGIMGSLGPDMFGFDSAMGMLGDIRFNPELSALFGPGGLGSAGFGQHFTSGDLSSFGAPLDLDVGISYDPPPSTQDIEDFFDQMLS